VSYAVFIVWASRSRRARGTREPDRRTHQPPPRADHSRHGEHGRRCIIALRCVPLEPVSRRIHHGHDTLRSPKAAPAATPRPSRPLAPRNRCGPLDFLAQKIVRKPTPGPRTRTRQTLVLTLAHERAKVQTITLREVDYQTVMISRARTIPSETPPPDARRPRFRTRYPLPTAFGQLSVNRIPATPSQTTKKSRRQFEGPATHTHALIDIIAADPRQTRSPPRLTTR